MATLTKEQVRIRPNLIYCVSVNGGIKENNNNRMSLKTCKGYFVAEISGPANAVQCSAAQCSAMQYSAGKQDPSDNLSIALLTTAAA